MIDWKYHLLGSIQCFFFSFFIFGLIQQIRKIQRRIGQTGEPTAVLHVRYYQGSISALFAYFLLGASLQAIDYYITISRFIAIALSLIILFLIKKYRNDRSAKLSWYGTISFFSIGMLITIFHRSLLIEHVGVIWLYSVISLGLLVYGQMQQLLAIHHHKMEGAISKEARILNILKDISVIIFSTYIHATHHWPIIVASSANIILCILIIRAIDTYQVKPNSEAPPSQAF